MIHTSRPPRTPGLAPSSSTLKHETRQQPRSRNTVRRVWTAYLGFLLALGVGAPALAQGGATVLISAVQGNGATSPLVDTVVTIEGVVVGDFQTGAGANGDMNGFFLQEEDADADNDASTSEGIFVFGVTTALATVNNGDIVRVTGTVQEFSAFSQPLGTRTQLTSVTEAVVLSTGNPLPTQAVIIPENPLNSLERFEGMSVSFSGPITVSALPNLDRFGEMSLIWGPRPAQFTDINAPDVAQSTAYLNDIFGRSILLDDGADTQGPDPIIYPDGQLNASDELRTGDTVSNLAGILDYAFNSFRIRQNGTVPVFTNANPRPASPPAVAGSLRIASFNVLNFFVTTRDQGNVCGPLLDGGCRGADNADEYGRQLSKLTAALSKLDADIIGLQELENTSNVLPLQALVSALNSELGANTYSAVDTGVYGDDAIRQGLLYKPARVAPIGSFAILDRNFSGSVGAYDDAFNRPTLLQTFEEAASGERFSVAVVHLKSKGFACDSLGDPDTGDGQGNCAVTRTNAAILIREWIATDPTNSNDLDHLILGDFNAYAKEDPITTLESAGYTRETTDYSFVFAGQAGALDHILASPGFGAFVTGQGSWHINADEADAIDYNNDTAGFPRPAGLFSADEFRSSDHDPVLIGMYLEAPSVTPPSQPVINRVDAEPEGITVFVTVANTGGAPIDALSAECTGGGETLNGTGSGDRVTISGVTVGSSYSCTVTAENAAGFSSTSAASSPITVEEIATGLPVWLLIEGREE